MLTVAPNGTIGLSDVRQKKAGGKLIVHHQSEVVICKCGKLLKHSKHSGRLVNNHLTSAAGLGCFAVSPAKTTRASRPTRLFCICICILSFSTSIIAYIFAIELLSPDIKPSFLCEQLQCPTNSSSLLLTKIESRSSPSTVQTSSMP